MNARRRLSGIFAIEGAAVAVVFIAMIVVFSITSSAFMTVGNIDNLLVQAAFVILLAAGMAFVLITGGIDLSVGSVLGLSAGTTLWVLMHGAPLIVGLLVGVGTGVVAGLVNGTVIALLGVNDFIVTLAMLSIAGGLLEVLTAKVQLTGTQDSGFLWLSHGRIAHIPAPIVIVAVVAAILELVLSSTPFGRSVFAAGIGPRAAVLAGVPVKRVRFQVYVLSGACAGGAGVLLGSNLNSVQTGLGGGYELTAIAAAVIGGISLAGGRGSVWRAVLGGLFLETLSEGLQLLGVDPLWFTIVTGLSIVVAVALDRIVSRIATSGLNGQIGGRPASGSGGGLDNDDVPERPHQTYQPGAVRAGSVREANAS